MNRKKDIKIFKKFLNTSNKKEIKELFFDTFDLRYKKDFWLIQ